jgi:hypothetical protein
MRGRTTKSGRKAKGADAPRILGYTFAAQDGDLYYYPDEPPEGVLCEGCGSPLNWEKYENHVTVRSRREVLPTYDGHFLVNRRFRQFCFDRGFRNIAFVPADRSQNYFDFRPKKILKIDAQKSKLQRILPCDACNQYAAIHTDPEYLFYLMNVRAPLADGFYRTDLLLAHGEEKRPALICALKTARDLYEAKFKDLVFFPIPFGPPTRKPAAP